VDEDYSWNCIHAVVYLLLNFIFTKTAMPYLDSEGAAAADGYAMTVQLLEVLHQHDLASSSMYRKAA